MGEEPLNKSKTESATPSTTPPTNIYIVAGKRILKCTSTQLRNATAREECSALAMRLIPISMPTNVTEILKEVKGEEYEDISTEKPEEW